jgi:hypothetical protein
MSDPTCATPIAFTTLVDYWVGDGDAADEARIEEHLFGCGECTAALARLVEIAEGIGALVGKGAVFAVLAPAFVQRLLDDGVHLREYRVPRGGSVNCTVAPEDDVVVARLAVPLAGVPQVDLVLQGFGEPGDRRLRDVPFDGAAGEVVLVPRIDDLRRLGAAAPRMLLIAVDGRRESVLGEYTFLHAPWRAP